MHALVIAIAPSVNILTYHTVDVVLKVARMDFIMLITQKTAAFLVIFILVICSSDEKIINMDKFQYFSFIGDVAKFASIKMF